MSEKNDPTAGLKPVGVLDGGETWGGPLSVDFLTEEQLAKANETGLLPDEGDVHLRLPVEELIDAWRTLKAIRNGTIAVVVEGGVVQSVVTDTDELADIKILTIDYDTDGADADEIKVVPQDDGGLAYAKVVDEVIGDATVKLNDIRKMTPEEAKAKGW